MTHAGVSKTMNKTNKEKECPKCLCKWHGKKECKNMVILGKFFGKRAGHKSHCGCPFSEV